MPLAVQLTAANVHDSKLLEPLVDAVQPIRRPMGEPGRPRKQPAKLHADKGYDFPTKRQALRQRGITLRPGAKHETMIAARQRQDTAAFKAQYAARAGVEGTLAQGTRVFGLRPARYRGLPKTPLQHVLTAVSMNVVRLLAWTASPTHHQTQTSRFTTLAPAA